MTNKSYKLSVIIPSLNEKNTILKLVTKVINSDVNKEIIIIDGNSTDGTKEILKEKIEPMVDKVIYQKQKNGKGGGILDALPYVTGDIIIIQDADLEYDPAEYKKIIDPILKGEADVVYGSRFKEKKNHKGYRSNYLANRFLTFICNLFTGLKLTDMETCYKAIKTDMFKSLDIKEKRFGFEPEVTCKLAKKKCIFKEVPISYIPRTFEEGKKIGFKDGLRAIYCIIKYH